MSNGGPTSGGWLLTFIRENAFPLIVAVFAAYSWFVSSNATLAGKIDALDRKLDRIEATANTNSRLIEGRRQFMNETAVRLNAMCDRDDKCRHEPMMVPP